MDAHGLICARDRKIARDFSERFEHEKTIEHARVWHGEAGLGDHLIAIEQEIEVERARAPETFLGSVAAS